MNKKENLLVYPYDAAFLPMLRYKRFTSMYSSISLVSPKGWGICGKDAAYPDKSEPLGINISDEFDSLLPKSDTVIFCKSRNHIKFEAAVLPKLINAINLGKNIVCTIELKEDTLNEIKRLCNDKNISFKYYNKNQKTEVFYPPQSKLQKINTPIILVFGNSERTNKFHIQLVLRDYLLDSGYKVSQIGSRDYCEMLGFTSFPGFMFDTRFTEEQKVIMFNNFIKRIETTEQPDVIVIGLPGGIMAYNDKFTNRFGILAYEVCSAVKADASICSILYEDYTAQFMEEIIKLSKYRFGLEIDCFNIANNRADWFNTTYADKVQYLVSDQTVVDEKVRYMNENNFCTFNTLKNDEGTKAAAFLVDKLLEYGEAQII